MATDTIVPFSSTDQQEDMIWKLNLLLEKIEKLQERVKTLETT